MRLKMRIVLFCLLLVFARETGGRTFIGDQKYLFWRTGEQIPDSPIILFQGSIHNSPISAFEAGYISAKLITDDDTIALQLIDTTFGYNCIQWLLRSGEKLNPFKQYTFCIQFYRTDSKDFIQHCYLFNRYTVTVKDTIRPVFLEKPGIIETHDNMLLGKPINQVLIAIDIKDQSPTLVRAVYTDQESGEKLKGYFPVDSTIINVGSETDFSIIHLNPERVYSLELTLIDQAGNYSAPIIVSERIQFKRNGVLNYRITEKGQFRDKITLVSAGLALFLFGILSMFIRYKINIR